MPSKVCWQRLLKNKDKRMSGGRCKTITGSWQVVDIKNCSLEVGRQWLKEIVGGWRKNSRRNLTIIVDEELYPENND